MIESITGAALLLVHCTYRGGGLFGGTSGGVFTNANEQPCAAQPLMHTKTHAASRERARSRTMPQPGARADASHPEPRLSSTAPLSRCRRETPGEVHQAHLSSRVAARRQHRKATCVARSVRSHSRGNRFRFVMREHRIPSHPINAGDRQASLEKRSPARGLPARTMPTEPSFSRAEVFPLIARLILASHGDEAGFVAHAAIVAGLLADGERADVVARVRAESSFPDERACASDRVQWFS